MRKIPTVKRRCGAWVAEYPECYVRAHSTLPAQISIKVSGAFPMAEPDREGLR